MSDALKDILLENEQIIWSGAPDYTRAKTRRKSGRFATLLWAIAIAVMIAVMFWASQTESVTKFFQGVFGTFTVLLLIVFACLCMYIVQGQKNPQPKERYALTNLRLMVMNEETGERSSYFGDALIWFKSFENGTVRDLSLMMAHTDEEHIILRAVDDAAKIETLLIQHGIARRPKS